MAGVKGALQKCGFGPIISAKIMGRSTLRRGFRLKA